MGHLLKVANGHLLKKPSGHLAITPNVYWTVKDYTITWTGSARFRYNYNGTISAWTESFTSGSESHSFSSPLSNPASTISSSFLSLTMHQIIVRYYGPSHATTPDTLYLSFGQGDGQYRSKTADAVKTAAGMNYEGAVAVTWVRPSDTYYEWEVTIDDVYFEPTSFW